MIIIRSFILVICLYAIIIITFPSYADDGKNITEYSFADISWTDNIKTISKKIEKTGALSALREQNRGEKDIYGRALRGVHLDNDSPDDWQIERRYDEACSGVKNESIIYTLNSDAISKSGSIMGASFFFSPNTGKLLHYKVYFRNKYAQDIYDSTIKKYGREHAMMKSSKYKEKQLNGKYDYADRWAYWGSSAERLYLQISGESIEDVWKALYINTANIEEVINICEQVKSANEGSAKSKTNLF